MRTSGSRFLAWRKGSARPYLYRCRSGTTESDSRAALLRADLPANDVAVKGTDSYPIAQSLQLRGIPFKFVTAFGVGLEMGAFRRRPPIRKPFRPVERSRLVASSEAGTTARNALAS